MSSRDPRPGRWEERGEGSEVRCMKECQVWQREGKEGGEGEDEEERERLHGPVERVT